MDGELMDLAEAFDDNPADEIGGENETPVTKPAKEPVVKEVIVEDDGDEEELDDEGNEVDPNADADLDLELDAEGNEIQPTGEISDETLVKLVVDGKEETKTYGQLKADAQKYAGAEKRFEEAAAIRKDAEAKLPVLTEREKQLGQVLEYYIAQSTQFMEQKQPDWEKLIAEDPQKYLATRHEWEKKQAELNQARQIKTELQRQNAEQEQASKSQRVAEERTKLLGAIPEWQDPTKAAEGAREVSKYLADAGIPAEMLSDIDHHQVLVIARKALLYDRAIAKQKAARDASANGKDPVQQKQRKQQVRVERPGAATPVATVTQRSQASRQKAAQAFKAAPSVDTLASLFE